MCCQRSHGMGGLTSDVEKKIPLIRRQVLTRLREDGSIVDQ